MYELLEDWGKVILRAAIILVVLFYFCWPTRLDGASMEPNFYDGDLVCVSRMMAMTGRYEKGDTVTFEYYAEGERHTLLKRVIALEGDSIVISPEGVFINDERIEEAYTNQPTNGLVNMVVPADCIFVMGDNREISFDSRHFGVVSAKDIQGQVILRIPIGGLLESE